MRYDLCINGQRKIRSGHRMVALTFLDNPKSKPYVNHIDGNKINNTLNNLEWCTHQENVTHAYTQLSIEAHNKKPVLCVELNKYFSSVVEASNYIHGDNGHICEVCNGKRKTAYGYTWKYI